MEQYQISLFLISAVVFLSYYFAIIFKFGVQPSISDSYYKLKDKNQWTFTAAIWGFSFPLVVLGFEVHPIFAFAATFTMFVGIAPMFKEKGHQRVIHTIGAIVGILLALAGLIISGLPKTACAMIVAMVTIFFYQVKNELWWIETVAFVGIWGGLFYLTLN